VAETSGLASLAGQTAAAEAEAPEEEFSVGNFVGEVYDSMSPLDKAALFTAPVPILGDIVGFAADGVALYEDPSATNAALMGLGLIPFVPSGGVTRTAQKAFTNLRNDIPGFYGTTDPVRQGTSALKTVPEGVTNIVKARYNPTSRAIQDQHNISVADQTAARNALKVSEEITPEIAALEARMKELSKVKDGKYPSPEALAEIMKLDKEASKLRSTASQAAKKSMGQLNQSLSMTKQYGGLKGLLKNIDGVDHVRTFENFNVDDYFNEMGDFAGIDKEDINGMFEQIKKVQRMDPDKTYQMNIRKVHTKTSGELDPGMAAAVYRGTPVTVDVVQDGIVKQVTSKPDINLNLIKKEVFGKTYTSDKDFLDALDEAGIAVRNRDEVLKGRAAIITGSGNSDAWELGGVNYMTSINKDGKVVTIVNDEHDLFKAKLPGADRYMNVSEPIFYDLAKTKKLTDVQQAAKDKLQASKDEAVISAIAEYTKIPGVDITGNLPAGFKTKEQWARAQAVAKIQPDKKDYSRLAKDFGIGAPVRASKAVLGSEEEVQAQPQVQRKRGGSVIERNPYSAYAPKAI
jgi:phosphohistidine swiveling domain-containing protein